MIVYLVCDETSKVVQLTSFACFPDGGKRAKIQHRLHPGESYYGYTFDMLWALGSGKHDLEFPPPGSDRASTSSISQVSSGELTDPSPPITPRS
jgi:hypothetical protein